MGVEIACSKLVIGDRFLHCHDRDLADMVDVGAGLLRAPTDKSDVYLARYEQLEAAFAQLLELEKLPGRGLSRVNEGHSKQYAAEINAVFETDFAAQLKARSHSEITRTLGYDP